MAPDSSSPKNANRTMFCSAGAEPSWIPRDNLQKTCHAGTVVNDARTLDRIQVGADHYYAARVATSGLREDVAVSTGLGVVLVS